MRTTKAQRYAATVYNALALAVTSPDREPVERVTKWEGAGNCYPNLIRDYERYGSGERAWFSERTMRFFRTRLEGAPLDLKALGVSIFLTSEAPPLGGRFWTARAYVWATASLYTLGEHAATDAKTAQDAFDILWRVYTGR